MQSGTCLFIYIKGASKNSDFFVRARKRRAENRSVYEIHEDLSTALTLLSRKKCIFRGALKINRIGGQTPVLDDHPSSTEKLSEVFQLLAEGSLKQNLPLPLYCAG